MTRLLPLAAALALAGCSAPPSPTASAYALAASLAAAERAALAYTTLPACGVLGASVACSDPAAKARIKAADNAAYAAVKAAEAGAPAGYAAEAIAALVAATPVR